MRIFLLTVLSIYTVSSYANTAIETETAQIGKQGEIGFSQALEYGKAKDGVSGGTLTQFEYGISDRSEILIEPFFYVWDHPNDDSKVDGPGDLEITPSYMVTLEHGWTPAVLVAFKLKVPTGSKTAGSSGEYDYLPYVIIGQHYGAWTFNANLGVNLVTPPGGSALQRTNTWALEAEREVAPNWTTFYEVFSTEDAVKTASAALQYQWTPHANTFAALGYSHEDEIILRFGFNLEY